MTAALLPSLCAACGRSCEDGSVVCARCARRLAAAAPLRGAGPSGVDRAWSAAPYEGVARDLVASLKFRALLPVAGLMAERILWLAPGHMLSGEVVPVPTARARSVRRGFDPAGEIAAALADRAGLPAPALSGPARRRPSGRQTPRRTGRPPAEDPRQRRGAAAAPCSSMTSSPPARPWPPPPAPCATPARVRVVAITFARRL